MEQPAIASQADVAPPLAETGSLMATTEMSPHNSLLPPPLYSAGEGTATLSRRRDDLPATPMFLVSLQDEIERSNRRQAFWMSVLAHLVALVVFINGAKLLPANKILGPTQTELLQNHEYTFLVLPPDLQKSVPAPHTNVLSDKNRIATTSHQPVIDHRVLQHILSSSHQGSAATKPHVPQGRRLPAQDPAGAVALDPAAAHPPAHIQGGPPEMATVPAAVPPAMAKVAASPVASNLLGSSVSRGGGVPDGLNVAGAPPASQSNVDVLSDTMGVDFGPYLSHVLHAVRINWYNRIPESARAPLMKRGKVSIQFDILRTGQIAGMQVVGSSGDASLDGAAVIGISGSGPFPPLPPQFQGQYLALRFHFFYNPDGTDLR